MRRSRETTRINVLFLLDKASYDGRMHGGGRTFLNTVSRIDGGTFRAIPCILRQEDSVNEAFKKRGLEVKYLGRNRFDPRVLLDLIQLIREERVQVMHLNSFGSQQFGRLASAITGIPTVLHAHGLTDYPRAWYQRLLDRVLARYTSKAIAVSKDVRNAYVAERFIGEDKFVVMPNGIALDEFEPLDASECTEVKQRFGIPESHYVVGTITRLREEKGNEDFIQAAPRVLECYPNTCFVIVGEGPRLYALKALARSLGIEHQVIFTGFCDDIRSILGIFHVNVVSTLAEGCSNAVLEAMAMGKATVATNVSGIREVLTDGKTAALVPPRNPAVMAERIIHLLGNTAEREKLAGGVRSATHRYSIDVYVRSLEKIYRDVMAADARCATHA